MIREEESSGLTIGESMKTWQVVHQAIQLELRQSQLVQNELEFPELMRHFKFTQDQKYLDEIALMRRMFEAWDSHNPIGFLRLLIHWMIKFEPH